jgi:DNA-3-methyladenine glycosylase
MRESKRLGQEFLRRPVETVAPDLIGCHLFTTVSGERVGGMIIETEAYNQEDIFSHCFTGDGRSRQTCRPMHFSAGSIYLYYAGQALCLNVSCDEREGFGSAVLIRAIEPTVGFEVMRSRRMIHSTAKKLRDDINYKACLTNGPANLCDALGLDDEHYKLSLVGSSVFEPPFELWSSREIVNSTSSRRYGLEKQLVKMKKLGWPRAESPEAQSHLERKWRWRITQRAELVR